MILVIDNYDSFVYNLVQYIGEFQPELVVYRNDAITIEDIRKMQPEKIVISPGPGRPDQAGISKEVIKTMGETTPILGVCLGHQCIGEVYGGRVVRSTSVLHGKTSMIYHCGYGIFHGLELPFEATRYHSLIVERESLPECLEIVAWTKDNLIMGLRHKEYPVWGVQFHPESIMTKEGKKLIKSFLEI
ncbi:aminodeoxychorismate/anthranilate synthase component II [Candidatus Sumerlaeota bacterium]|nr:aminodeoxychorismate/anthranilate synthase component II [Candidatus Sumerlaeota bacterium]